MTDDVTDAGDHAPAPRITGDPDPEYDYEGQDFSGFEEIREAEIEAFGVRFHVTQPRTYEDAMSLVTAPVDGPEVLCRRTLATLIVRPDPLGPVLDRMEPWQMAVLATELVDWAGIDDYIDEVESLRALRTAAAEQWARDPPDPAMFD